MNHKIYLRNLEKSTLYFFFYFFGELFYFIFIKHYIFFITLILSIFQIIILILFIFIYDLDFLLNKYRQRKQVLILKKNSAFNSFDFLKTTQSNKLLNSSSNPPIRGNVDPRTKIKNNEDINDINVSHHTNIMNNNNLNNNNENNEISENEISIISNIENNSSINNNNRKHNFHSFIQNNSLLKENENIYYFNKNYKNNLKNKNSVCYFLKKYVPFINIFIFNDLNIYIIKLSLFLFWLNLLIFFNIIFQFIFYGYYNVCEDDESL